MSLSIGKKIGTEATFIGYECSDGNNYYLDSVNSENNNRAIWIQPCMNELGYIVLNNGNLYSCKVK